MSPHTPSELSKEAAAAARQLGDGVTCTGSVHCRCPGCREDERERADWAEQANATAYAEERAAARIEVSE